MINYSIIIPHYNTPDLLARCLRSIPQRDDIQVIVVDDNSPGVCFFLEAIPELSRKDTEFYVTKDGRGAGHARNIGLTHAIGKWLLFADSDDFFVENFSDILDEYVNDNHDIIFFNIKSCDCYNTNRILTSKNKERLFSTYKKSKNELIFRIGYTEPWGKIIRRQIIVDNGISFQETKGHNDLLFSVRAGLTANRIKVVDRPLYWYVIREGSLGHQKGVEPIEKIKDRILAWNSTQRVLFEAGIKTRTYLPAIPCIRVIKRDITMCPQLIQAAKSVGCSPTRVLFEIIRYFPRVALGGYGLGLDEQLPSSNKWKR